MRLKWSKSWENHEAQCPKLSVFIGQKSIFRYYCIENFKDGPEIQVYNIDNECLTHFSQFISVKVKKNLRKSQAQFREKLRKLRFRQNNDFFHKKPCIQERTPSLSFNICIFLKLLFLISAILSPNIL